MQFVIPTITPINVYLTTLQAMARMSKCAPRYHECVITYPCPFRRASLANIRLQMKSPATMVWTKDVFYKWSINLTKVFYQF